MISKGIRQYLAACMINSMPQPPLVTLFTYITPHLVHLRFFNNSFNLNINIIYIKTINQRCIYCLNLRCFFFNSEITVDVLILSTRAVSRIPLPFNAISTTFSFVSRNLPVYVYSSMNVIVVQSAFVHLYLCLPFLVVPALIIAVPLQVGHKIALSIIVQPFQGAIITE